MGFFVQDEPGDVSKIRALISGLHEFHVAIGPGNRRCFWVSRVDGPVESAHQPLKAGDFMHALGQFLEVVDYFNDFGGMLEPVLIAR